MFLFTCYIFLFWGTWPTIKYYYYIMVDDIVSRISNLKIMAEEGIIVALDDVTEDDFNAEINLTLVGKVMTVRSYNFAALNRTMNQIWSLSKGALFRAIENGLFVVQFANARDKAKVLSGRPWTFDQNLVMLNDIDGTQQPSGIAMTMFPFWIRLYNLPLGCRSENTFDWWLVVWEMWLKLIRTG